MSFKRIMPLCCALIMTACGTIATPVWDAPEPIEVGANTTSVDVATIAPTATTIPPTATPTPIPPTATPTEIIPTETAIPTEAPVINDVIVQQVAFSDPNNGERWFNTEFETSSGIWVCSTCHSLVEGEVKVGPSLYGIAERAATRVEGQLAERYIYNSIVHPNEYVVEGFAQGLMPQNYAEILTETQLLELTAYLMTLTGE